MLHENDIIFADVANTLHTLLKIKVLDWHKWYEEGLTSMETFH